MTAPIGWGVNSHTNLDVPTYYSNFGTNRINFAAPGGTDEYFYTNPSAECTVAGVTEVCFAFDYVFSTIPGGWGWAAGTSMAAPHAAGVAAQYMSAAGGWLPPLAVEAILKATRSAIHSLATVRWTPRCRTCTSRRNGLTCSVTNGSNATGSRLVCYPATRSETWQS